MCKSFQIRRHSDRARHKSKQSNSKPFEALASLAPDFERVQQPPSFLPRGSRLWLPAAWTVRHGGAIRSTGKRRMSNVEGSVMISASVVQFAASKLDEAYIGSVWRACEFTQHATDSQVSVTFQDSMAALRSVKLVEPVAVGQWRQVFKRIEKTWWKSNYKIDQNWWKFMKKYVERFESSKWKESESMNIVESESTHRCAAILQLRPGSLRAWDLRWRKKAAHRLRPVSRYGSWFRQFKMGQNTR